MATYTIELRNVIELYGGGDEGRAEVESWFKDYELTDYLTQDQVDEITKHGIWSKDKLASKIIDHYYMREIGFETPALFKHQAKVMMQELMEAKAPIIWTLAFEYDPLINVDYTETYKQTRAGTDKQTGSSTGTSTGTSTTQDDGSGLTVNSDTPQGEISKSKILGGTYASSTQANETTDKQTGSSTANSTASSEQNGESNENTEYTKNIKGNSGVTATYQAMIRQYRNVIATVDRDIIRSLHPLFMGVF